jgi:hypothetical protein
MAEKDIRTKLKSVYVLHRFSVDGGVEHREALKQRLRALRKTRDPKRGGNTRYFDSKVLIGVDEDVSCLCLCILTRLCWLSLLCFQCGCVCFRIQYRDINP